MEAEKLPGTGDEVTVGKMVTCLAKQTALAGGQVVLAQVAVSVNDSPQLALSLWLQQGSRAFNLHMDTSDEDLFGVFQAPVESVLTGNYKRSVCGHEPTDYETHELEEFLLLLCKGNPKVIEPLYTDRLVWRANRIAELCKRARLVTLSQFTLRQYVHYAKSQKGDDEETPAKKRYHALRLVLEAKRIAQGLEPRVVWEGEERELILSFRRGERSEAEFRAIFYEAVEAAKQPSAKLPEKTEVAQLEPLLVEARMAQMDALSGREELKSVIGDWRGDIALHVRAEKALEDAGVRGGTVVFVGASGAQLHGLPSSEVDDFVGVFVAPLSNVLGFESNRIARVEEGGVVLRILSCKNVSHGKGLVLFELSHFLSLLAAGNHRFVEQLYLTINQRFSCDWFDQIVKNFDQFRGKQVTEHLFGVLKGCVAAKKHRLAWRFVLACEALLLRDEWPLALSEKDRLLCVEGSEAELAERVAHLEAAKKQTVLRNTTPGRDWLAAHGMRLRKSVSVKV